jgi:hypothetical protein
LNQEAPVYNPSDIRSLLENEKVLFVGDSTSRQDYFTMLNIFNSTDNLSIEEINSNINNNQKTCTQARHHKKWLNHCYSIGRYGKFDAIKGPSVFEKFSKLPYRLNATLSDLEKEQYTFVVFSLGVWDVAKYNGCQNMEGLLFHLHNTLNVLERFVNDYNNRLLQQKQQQQQQQQQESLRKNQTTTPPTIKPMALLWKTNGGTNAMTIEQQNCTHIIQDETRK